jgi:hypothetical protein
MTMRFRFALAVSIAAALTIADAAAQSSGGYSRAGTATHGNFGSTIASRGVSASSQQPENATGLSVPPCRAAAVDVGGVLYYKCPDAWYARGYGAAGVVYVPVQAPPGQQ